MVKDEKSNKAYVDMIISQIKSAKSKYIKSQGAENMVYSLISDFIGDIDGIPSDAENADNLRDAISCYINYGEYNIKGLRKELMEAISKK